MSSDEFLVELLAIPGVSGDEGRLTSFLLEYVLQRGSSWKVTPEIHFGKNLQDNFILAFGEPKTAVFAHLDTVGFMARYENQLVPVGGPEVVDGDVLVGSDSYGEIECSVRIEDGNLFHDFGRQIMPGTILTYRQHVEITEEYIQAAYLDNRLGVYNALRLCESLSNGLVVFTTFEEHGGGAIPLLMRYIYERWRIEQALISDMTWASEGVRPGGGVVISLRDRFIPRRVFVERIIKLAERSGIPYQLEVEAYGSSDGREVHHSPFPVDWCFIGAPEENVHTSAERVMVSDLQAMQDMYRFLLEAL
ncbi:aminopeptidase, M42 family [Lunatimonas lonarensis]|uniref:Aminopeptidase, M42 family n=1 Tax=Lunatimonas lonarensis TaxID=1232681 RepID=R7ZUQ5_9BACT|nr:aminopeptidase M42 family [Lunatimonas lonarensis]EON77758.1 aminopeptidase, M42 family [Lunatimonas lonarensis]